MGTMYLSSRFPGPSAPAHKEPCVLSVATSETPFPLPFGLSGFERHYLCMTGPFLFSYLCQTLALG